MKINVNKVILASPMIWVSGLTPIFYQLYSIYFFALNKKKITSLSIFEILLAIFVTVYFFSISLALLRGESIIRGAAGLYNLSMWVAGASIVFSRYSLNILLIRKSSRNLLVLLLLASFICALLPAIEVSYPSLFGLIINPDILPPNIRVNTTLTFVGQDWSNLGLGYRITILSPYPTAYAMLIFLLVCLSWPESPKSLGKRIAFLLLILMATYAAVILAAARTAAGAISLFFLLLFYAKLISLISGKKKKIFLTFSLVLIPLFGSLYFFSYFSDLFSFVNDLRAGSSDLRFTMYEISARNVIDEHPMLGYGIKERDDYIARIPLGSHSTIISVLYKMGIIGVIFLLAILSTIFSKAMSIFHNRKSSNFDKCIAAGSISFMVILAFEDIDALPLVSFLYFIMIAILIRRSEELRKIPTKTIFPKSYTMNNVDLPSKIYT